jgi:hypothetical protein
VVYLITIIYCVGRIRIGSSPLIMVSVSTYQRGYCGMQLTLTIDAFGIALRLPHPGLFIDLASFHFSTTSGFSLVKRSPAITGVQGCSVIARGLLYISAAGAAVSSRCYLDESCTLCLNSLVVHFYGLIFTDDFHSVFVKIERENGDKESGCIRTEQPSSCWHRKRASTKHLNESNLVIFFPPPTHFSSISSELFRIVARNIAALDTFHHFSCQFTDWAIHQSIFDISWILLIVVCNLSISIGISMKSLRGSVGSDGVPLKRYLRCSCQFLFVLLSDTLQVPMKNRWRSLGELITKRSLGFLRLSLSFLRLCCLM